MKKKPVKKGAAKGSRTTLILGAVAALMLLLLVVMLALIPREKEEPAPTTEAPTTEAPTSETTEEPTTEPEETEPQMLAHMAELYAENPDIVGWIRIEGTDLDYPVMYTPDDEEKYLRLDFEGNVDLSGLPFVDKDCTFDPESQALVIYGHNMKNGTAFRTLFDYEKKAFLEEHPTIYFSTLYEERTYEVLAMFYDEIYLKTATNFKFYQFIDPETEEDFLEGIEYFKDKSILDTGVTAEYGDRLITLVTCAYHTDMGRYVVVAREVTEDVEAAEAAETAESTEATA